MKFNSAALSVLALLAWVNVSLAQSTISVNATQTVRTVDSRVFGLNCANWDGQLNVTANNVSLLKTIDCTIMRFPGGSTADTYKWPGSATVSFDKFAAVATNIGAQAFITVNYGSGTPDMASNWVAYSASHNFHFKYWEIGNECYGSWENDTHTPAHNAKTYATNAALFMQAMRTADPTIKIGIPAVQTSGANSFSGWTHSVLTNLNSRGVRPDFLVYHNYAQGHGNESDSGLLASVAPATYGSWGATASNLRTELNNVFGSTTATNIELVSTENNSVSSDPGKQTTSIVNALYYAESVGEMLQTEFNALVWWDLRNSQISTNNNNASLYGWRLYGDYGMINGSSSPYPTYYMAKLLTHFTRGGDKIAKTTSSTGNLAAYSAVRTDGSLSIMVINKTLAANNANVVLSNFTAGATATVYYYSTNEDGMAQNSPGTTSADIQTNSLSVSGGSINYTFKPYSVTIISVPTVSTPPTLGQAAVSLDGHFGFQLSGQSGATYIIQSSTDFIAWTPRTTNTLAGTSVIWSDPQPVGASPTFYRAASAQ